jgi:hypothetical protein
MPKVYIQIPDDITFVDSRTKEPMEGENSTMSFEDLLHKIMDNPKWNQSYKMIKAADAIMVAFEERSDGVMVLAEEDHKHLKDALENPKVLVISQINGAQTQPGFGIHPRLARQLMPLIDPAMDPLDKDPRQAKSEDEGAAVKAV